MNPHSKDNTSALILAGGQARRMGGKDKGLIKLNNRPMIAYIIEALQTQTKRILINANRNIDCYQQFGFPVIEDQLGGYQGPLAGMAAGLTNCKTDYLVTVPCDGPFISDDYVMRLQNARQQQDTRLSVAYDGTRLQPVYALLHKSLLPSLQQFLADGERKIDRWYEQHARALADFSDQEDLFVNINTPEDLQMAQIKLEQTNREIN